MKKIAISSAGEFYYVAVDDEDFPVLDRHKWYILHSGKTRRPYAFTRFYTEQDKKNGKTFLMHHMIMGTSGAVDHANGDSLDNQKSNLRVATYSQNGANRGKSATYDGKTPTSRYKGVHRSGGKWRAAIGHNKKTIWLGTFICEEDAALAYNAKAKELYGAFALLNDVN